jgi:hypothetical protein
MWRAISSRRAEIHLDLYTTRNYRQRDSPVPSGRGFSNENAAIFQHASLQAGVF